MHRDNLLTAGQIYQLRQAVTKIIQQNMISFGSRVSVNCQFQSKNGLQELYTFCEREYTKLQNHLLRMSQFTFQIMSNVQKIWQQVHHRQNKILQLRQSFSSATDYMQQLKMENDEMRSKLTEAETYIQYVQYQKEILDALYYQRERSSLSVANDTGRNLSKCLSQRSLRWQQNPLARKKNLSYQKLKQYIHNLKQQRQQLQIQLLTLTKQYELKCQQSKKANFFIEHLVQRLNTKNQLKQYIESLNNCTNETKEYIKAQINPQDFLKILQKTQNSPHSSKRSLVFLNEQIQQKNMFTCIESFSNIMQSQKECLSQNNISFFSKNNNYKNTKDVMVSTDKIIKKAACCQTQSFEGLESSKHKPDYKIQIQIFGKQKDKEVQIHKIIKDMNIQKQIRQKLIQQGRCSSQKRKMVLKQRQRQRQRDNKMMNIGNKWMSTYEYYQKKIISCRIKKYHYQKPPLNYLKNIKNK